MTQHACILVVDDEEAIRFFVSEQLSQAGYMVVTAASGEEALVRLEEQPVDLVLLDLKMGGINGLQVMEEIGLKPLPPEVIMLTAHASLDSAIGAMRRGGFDYLKKPYRPEALLASVEKALAKRRKALQRQQMIHLIEETARQLESVPRPGLEQAPPPAAGSAPRPSFSHLPRFLEGRGLLVDRDYQSVTRGGEAVPLTPSEFQLLACLIEQADRPMSYHELVTTLHGDRGGEWEEWEERQAINTHLWRLRRKLGRAPDGRPYIVNVRGVGYKFVSS